MVIGERVRQVGTLMIMEYHPQKCLCASRRGYIDGEEEIYEFNIRLEVDRH
jgi:hypothetical protein